MPKIILVALSLIICSCATNQTTVPDLQKYFVQLSGEVASGDVVDRREDYFSRVYLKEVNIDDENSLFLLNIPSHVKKIESYYQSLNKDTGCLTINGYESNGSPVSIYLEYIKENSHWVVNYMYLNLLEDKSGFKGKAICPKSIE